jgi:hypothetical protein
VLAGISWLFEGDLHDLELGPVGGAPHAESLTAGAVDDESSRRDEFGVSRAVVRPRIPALIELPWALDR